MQSSFCASRHVENTEPYFVQTRNFIDENFSLDKPNGSVYIRTVTSNPMSEAARILGSARTPRKAKTSRENGKLGGRPKKTKKKATKR